VKKLIALISFFSLSTTAFAGELPFNIVRDQNGKLERILISHKKKLMSSDDFLNELKHAVAQSSKSLLADEFEMEGFSKLSEEEQKAYMDSLELLKQKTIMSSLEDKKVKLELDKIIDLLTNKSFFKLLADTQNPKAFDEEIALVDAVNVAIDAAQQAFGTTPLFNVLEFLVSEYLESLVSQREFYQNALLAYINSTDIFTAEETATVKSSIFYSRLGLTKIKARKNALKKWATFGLEAEEKANKKCKQSEQTSFHYCFKLNKTQIANLVDKNNSLSKGTSKAFDYKNPGHLGRTRWFILTAKLGLKLLPVPGVVKHPVKKWLESFYLKQRRTEGLLYSSATLQNDTELANWILENTANPLIN